MNKRHLLLFTVIALFSAPFSQSFAFDAVKDAYYFLKDDGKFSDEEKDEEAQYIYQQCEQNVLQRVYFDCQCIAGAFRAARDTDENLRPQSTILTELFNDNTNQCVNKPAIAGESYKFCSHYAQTMRARAKNNEDYCGCVGNTVANQFADNPRLRTRHIENMRTNAMVSCNKKFKE